MSASCISVRGMLRGGPAPDLHAYTLHSLPWQQHAGTQGSCGYEVRGEGSRLHPSLHCAPAVTPRGRARGTEVLCASSKKEQGRLVDIAYPLTHSKACPQVSSGGEKGLVGSRVLHLGTWVRPSPLCPSNVSINTPGLKGLPPQLFPPALNQRRKAGC